MIFFLKSILAQKDDQMKSLLNKINSLEGEGNSLSQNMQDSVDKFNQDILKRSEDLEFYKRSYEEQKNRVNREVVWQYQHVVEKNERVSKIFRNGRVLVGIISG